MATSPSPSPGPMPSPGPAPTTNITGVATGSALQNRTTAGGGPGPFKIPDTTNTPPATTGTGNGLRSTYMGKPAFGNTFPNWGVGNMGKVTGKAWSQYQTPGYKAPQPTVPVSDSNPVPTGIVKSPQFFPQLYGLQRTPGSVNPVGASISDMMGFSPQQIHDIRPNRDLTGEYPGFVPFGSKARSKPAKRGYTNAELVSAANTAVGGSGTPGTRGATMNQVAQAAFVRKNNDLDRPAPNPQPNALHIAGNGFTYDNPYSQGTAQPGQSVDAYNFSQPHYYTPRPNKAPLMLNNAARAAYLNPTTVQ